MAVFDQPVSSYSDTTPHVRIITDVISLIDPSDAPMIEALGGLDGASGKFRFTGGDSTKYEWLEDTLGPLTDTMAATAASDATSLTVTDGSVWQPGDIIETGTQQMWVSAVSTNTLTVTRAFGGTTAATIASTATLTKVGQARLEGDESDSIGLTDRTSNSNYTQILHKEIKVTGTHMKLAQYGISDEMAYQGDKAVPELMRLLERHTFYNAAAAAGSGTTPRVMGGFQHFITDNLVSGATLAQSQFENAVKAAYADGGNGPWFAFCAPDNLQKIKNFYDSSNFLRIERGEKTVGMVIEQVLTPFGVVNLVLDRWAQTTEIPIVDVNHAGFKTYRPFQQEPLSKGGDYEKTQVIGEFTLCIRQDKAHAMLTNVS